MRTVNYCFIENALGVLEVAEAKQGHPLDIDPNDEKSSKQIFRQHVVPFVRGWPKWRQEKLHLSLAYYLRQPRVLDYQVLAKLQDLTLRPIQSVEWFFTWLWEALYPGEDYRAVDLAEIVENNDIMETNPQPQDKE